MVWASAGLLIGLIALCEFQFWMREIRRWRRAERAVPKWRSAEQECWIQETPDGFKVSYVGYPMKPVFVSHQTLKFRMFEPELTGLRLVRHDYRRAGFEYRRADTPTLFVLWAARVAQVRSEEAFFAAFRPMVELLYRLGYRWPEGEAWSWGTFWRGIQAGRRQK